MIATPSIDDIQEEDDRVAGGASDGLGSDDDICLNPTLEVVLSIGVATGAGSRAITRTSCVVGHTDTLALPA